MALQVWLPLNGNLNNQGIDNTTVTNNGATVDNNGKIGKCYSFSVSSAKITNTLSSSVTSAVGTMSCWVKFNSFPASGAWYCLMQLGTAGGFANCRLGLYMQYQTDIVVCINGSGDSNLYKHSLTTNQWYHLCTTFDGTTVRLYIDGVEVWNKTAVVGSYTTATSTLFVGGTNNYYFKGYMNDVRYYSTALSPKEVEVLSRGLVCHYPLNGGGRGGDNMLKNTNQGKTYWTWSAASGSRTVETYETTGVKMTVVEVGSSWNMWYYSGLVPSDIEPDTDYTVSVDILSPQNATIKCSIMQTNATNVICPTSDCTVTANVWNHAVFKLHSNSSFTPSGQVIYMNGIAPDTVGKTIYLKNLKLEKGTTATPWIPNSADTAYSAMGYNSTTEYDVSGYQNNMTKTGTITYTSDSARYSVAPHFINGSYLMANQNCTEYLPTDELTVNLWIKATTWGTPISCTEGGGWNIESYNNGLQFQCMITSVGYKPAWCNVTAASITDNKWHMLTGTFDRTAQQTKFYIDGVLKGTGNTGSTNGVGYASNRLIISGEAQSTTPASSYFVGEESDVRIYATALSATQVAELYNTAVSVANNGTLMGYELVEV